MSSLTVTVGSSATILCNASTHHTLASVPNNITSIITPSSSQFGSKAAFLSLNHSITTSSSATFKTVVSSVDSDLSSPSNSLNKEESNKYYFVVANAKFMLDGEEHFKEQLFERLRMFCERNIEQDFWLVIEPKFLDKFLSITRRLKRPVVALVFTNGPWITFMKLRLDRVLTDSFEAESVE